MGRKTHIDTIGALILVGFSLLLAGNQVAVKVTTTGFAPVFMAGARSFIGIFIVGFFMIWKGFPMWPRKGARFGAILMGSLFAYEFVCLFLALGVSSVSRVSIIFYSMPVWLSIAAHFLLEGERLTSIRFIGLCLALCGVVLAILSGSSDIGTLSYWGDFLALNAALAWAALALVVRLTKISEERAETQIFVQLLVSAPILLGASLLFGSPLRDPEPWHYMSVFLQALLIVAFAYWLWLKLMAVYPASGVASFSFLSPVFSVALGWLILGEHVGPLLVIGLVLVAVGLILINRKTRSSA